MLFKTQNASVYGIDAYLVEVEVDVGSARMQDFNVVGLPDNAVKESREGIKELRAPSSSEDSAAVRQRVIAARDKQIERFRTEKKTYANAQMMPKMIRKHCATSAEEKLLENAITRLGLSARAHDRLLKVARTIADLDSCENIDPRHLSEAIQYRTLDRSYWA
jgi:predicted ATPase with chaperone activity